MTFLLQKFNAINRTRTEARARNGLRPTAGGIAFTGRLAACLLLAGFLGVGSAMAQPHVLRVGGGEITVAIEGNLEVHHYQIGTAKAVDDPTGQGETTQTNTFLVGALALVTVDGTSLTVSPIATGAFKLALSADATEDLTDADDEEDNTNPGTPVFFEIMSVNSPQIVD